MRDNFYNRDYYSQKALEDKMNIKYLSTWDINVCNYVMRYLPYVSLDDVTIDRRIDFYELIEKSIQEMSIFGCDITEKIRNIVDDVSFDKSKSNILSYSVYYGYPSYDNNQTIDTSAGFVSHYEIPKEFYEWSIFMLAHEHVHALKDTNYSECRDKNICGECIPLFYELTVLNPDKISGKLIMRNRLKCLLGNRKEFLMITQLKNECDYLGKLEEYELHKYVAGTVGLYLNSFYYAVILYNMYKQSPKKILDMVSRVLKHELTTLEMLEQLGIYGDIRGEVFEKELGNIRKLIK